MPVFVIIALLAFLPPAHAASKDGTFAVKGVGAETCASYTKAAEERSRLVDIVAGWVEGYLTAINRHRADTFDIAPWQSTRLLLALIYAHCKNKPQDRLFQVVHDLQRTLAQSRMRTRSDLVEIPNGKGKLSIYREVLRRAQKKLIAEGYLKGSADGAFGPKTRSALEAFQEKAGLPKTGVPDQETLFKLLLEKKVVAPKG